MMLKFLSVAILLFSINSIAQLGSTKSQIIQKYPDYEMDKADDGTDYILYEVAYEEYNSIVACYLSKVEDNQEQLCVKVIIIEPSSETNAWIQSFREKNYVKLDGMVWKDYENSVVYKVEVNDGSCYVLKYIDNEL